MHFLLEPVVGSAAPSLTALAERERCELLVVGAHRQRRWEGSTASAALQTATCAVACVPFSSAAEATHPTSLTAVVVATDFSTASVAAVSFAWSMLASHGTLHLVHVLPHGPRHDDLEPRDIFKPSTAPEEAQRHARSRLQLAAPESGDGARQTAVHVLEAASAAEAIMQAADRLGAQAIVVGSHGQSALRGALLGSVAQQVSARAALPVVVVKAAQG